MPETPEKPQTKVSYVMSFPPATSAAAIVEKGKADGVALTVERVHKIRSDQRSRAKVKAAKAAADGSAPKSSKSVALKATAASAAVKPTKPSTTSDASATKADFVRTHPELSMKDLLAAASAAGLKLSPSHAFALRAELRKSGTHPGSTTTSAPKPSKPKGGKKKRTPEKSKGPRPVLSSIPITAALPAPTSGSSIERELRMLVLQVGIHRAEAVIAEVRARLMALVDG